MKFTRPPIVRRWLCACACLVLAGCGGDEGADADYSGAWQGRTSNGGTVVFTVQGAQVVALRLTDPGGEIWFPQPTDIVGHSFSAEYGTDTAATDDVFLKGTFVSDSDATGRYEMRKGSHVLSGTFAAQRQ